MRCLACRYELPGHGAITSEDPQGVAPGDFEVRVCPGCGGGTTLPLVGAEELAKYYPQAYGPHSRQGASGPLARAAMAARLRTRLFRRLRRVVASRGGDGGRPSLLDVGSGSGDLGSVLTGQGWRVVGLEPSAAACELARRRGVETREGTLETAELPEASFDAVVFHHSLEHVPDPVDALRAARSLLRPGGAAAIAVPNFDSRQRRRLGSNWWALDLPRHRFHFSFRALHAALERSGLESTWLRPTASVLGPAASAQQRRSGRMEMSGGRFLAGYGAALVTYPLRWALAEALGDGEFIAAIATPRAGGISDEA
ncbi:MAG: class I SAM-dependent methyltransferase [Actinobacteria bacterium]|nr:class I SAM-dependent methyltransferase [Actinomycetota bacterium]